MPPGGSLVGWAASSPLWFDSSSCGSPGSGSGASPQGLRSFVSNLLTIAEIACGSGRFGIWATLHSFEIWVWAQGAPLPRICSSTPTAAFPPQWRYFLTLIFEFLPSSFPLNCLSPSNTCPFPPSSNSWYILIPAPNSLQNTAKLPRPLTAQTFHK